MSEWRIDAHEYFVSFRLGGKKPTKITNSELTCALAVAAQTPDMETLLPQEKSEFRIYFDWQKKAQKLNFLRHTSTLVAHLENRS